MRIKLRKNDFLKNLDKIRKKSGYSVDKVRKLFIQICFKHPDKSWIKSGYSEFLKHQDEIRIKFG